MAAKFMNFIFEWEKEHNRWSFRYLTGLFLSLYSLCLASISVFSENRRLTYILAVLSILVLVLDKKL